MKDRPRSSGSAYIGRKVAHIYDHKARGFITGYDETFDLVLVEWEGQKKSNPCTRDELIPIKENR